MIKTLMLVDDEDLFHLVFDDVCNIMDITLKLQPINSSDIADQMFKEWSQSGNVSDKPECVFVDLNLIGSSYDGIELINRINTLYGNSVVIGVISSSLDSNEIERAKSAGAQFWMIKSDEIEPRLAKFKLDYDLFKTNSIGFTIYK
jgi:CheY-like chemotaxis protein